MTVWEHHLTLEIHQYMGEIAIYGGIELKTLNKMSYGRDQYRKRINTLKGTGEGEEQEGDWREPHNELLSFLLVI